jgi:F-type H+-transporting ATPase subunit b
MTESGLSIAFKFINFGILVALLVKYAGQPFMGLLRKRHDTVGDTVNEAERLLREAEEAKAMYEERLGRLDAEIETFRKTALAEAEREKKRLLDEAGAMAARIREQARLAYEQEMRDALSNVRGQIARMTTEAAEKTVKDLFKKEDNDRMVDELIEQLGSHR